MNPANVVAMCGAECGLGASAGTASAGLEHLASVVGTPTVVTSGPTMRSTRCWQMNPSGATEYVGIGYGVTAPTSGTTVVHRFYIWFDSLPAADTKVCSFQGNATTGIRFKQATSTLVTLSANTEGGTPFTVTTGQWYRIDLRWQTSLNNLRVDAQVNGTALGQAFAAGAAVTPGNILLGIIDSTTATIYIDDYLGSATSADYPIGEGVCVGLYVTSDGSHNYNAAGDFLRDGSTNLGLAATDAWTELQDPLSTTIGSFLTAAAPATSEYVRCRFEDLPSDVSTLNGVCVVATAHAASATQCAHDVLVVDDSATSGTTVVPEINFLGGWAAGVFTTGVDLSETTITCPYAIGPTGASTGAWTIANINDLAVIFGGTDVNPDAHLDGVCLEIDYVPVATLPRQVSQQQQGWRNSPAPPPPPPTLVGV